MRYVAAGLGTLLLFLAFPRISVAQNQPLGTTGVRPIFQTQGVFPSGLGYQLFITLERASLSITNNTGVALDKGVTLGLGLLDEQQSLREVLIFEFQGSIEAGQTTTPVAARGTPPSDAKFYTLVYWDTLGVRLPPRRVIFAMSEPNSPSMTHQTSDFLISFSITPREIGFVLTNRSQSLIRLIWDESVFIDRNARTHKVTHAGIRFIERDRSMPPTPIPPGARLEDLFFPVTYVYYVSGRYGGWNQLPLYKDDDPVPFTLGIFMTLEIGAQKKAFNHRFSAARDWPSELKSLFSR